MLWKHFKNCFWRSTCISVGEIGRDGVALSWREPLKALKEDSDEKKASRWKKIKSCSPVVELSVEINRSQKREGSAGLKLPACPGEAPNSVSLGLLWSYWIKAEKLVLLINTCVCMQVSAVAVYLLETPLWNLYPAFVEFSKGLNFWDCCK